MRRIIEPESRFLTRLINGSLYLNQGKVAVLTGMQGADLRVERGCSEVVVLSAGEGFSDDLV